jgi:hypothetical protein
MISTNPDKYGIEVTRNEANLWLKHRFGTGVDVSFWQYDWKTASGRLPRDEQIVADAYHELCFTERNSDPGWSQARKHAVVIRNALRFVLLSRRLGHRSYERRFWLLARKHLAASGVVFSRARLMLGTDGHLEANLPLNGTGRRVSLSEEDIRFLRAAYWADEEKVIKKQLGIGDAEFERLIAVHEALGTIARYRRKLVATVNDPGYWKSAAVDHHFTSRQPAAAQPLIMLRGRSPATPAPSDERAVRAPRG